MGLTKNALELTVPTMLPPEPVGVKASVAVLLAVPYTSLAVALSVSGPAEHPFAVCGGRELLANMQSNTSHSVLWGSIPTDAPTLNRAL